MPTPEELLRMQLHAAHEERDIMQQSLSELEAKTNELVQRMGKEFESVPHMFQDVADFCRKRGQEYSGPPRDLPAELVLERISRRIEELAEQSKAYCRKDRAKVLDALVDDVYYAIGEAYLAGFNFNEAWRRVHDANMRKVRPVDGGPSKPEGWEPADLSDLV